MVPLNTWRDPLNGSGARGGAPDLGAAAGWYLSMGLGELLRRYASDQEALGAAVFAWAQEQDRLGPFGYWSLPMRDFAPLRRLSVGAAFFETMTTLMDRNDRTTAAANIAARQAGVMVPSLNIGGWYDIFLGDTIANYQFMRSQGAPAKLLLGPWTHITSNNPVGERSFGTASQTSFLYLQTDQHALQLRWFDHWLKGIDTGMLQEPPVRIFVMGTNVWRDEADWPLARARMTRFHLHEGGRLSPLAPGDEAPDVYMYDPEDPTPTLGGSTLMTPDYPAGPYDQRPIEERPDVLVYTSDVLGEDLEVTGPLTVYLWAVSSAPDTDFVARLTDVLPDGCSYNLADGIVRARYRNFGRGEAPSPIEPGRPYLYEIDLWATSNVFLAGHRIRLHITSSSFPRWGRNQNTGHELSADSQMEAAWQTILHDAEHPSCVMLPLVAA
jgi:putative CocE/NonD family hydrolase